MFAGNCVVIGGQLRRDRRVTVHDRGQLRLIAGNCA
jgi:hypothetical protein